ncbi:MAG: glycosyltransferase family 4 protein [Lentisphaerae bacterium]|nr:glycosyltransferase family 4 protein [Lentisphaerota bacterium]
MNIIQIVPGSGGGFYCQNCVRDVGLARQLHRMGHKVVFVPLYLPFMEMADEAVTRAPVFYGAINVYLAQKLPLYRRLPEKFRRFMDAPSLLRWAASRAGSTQAAGLGDMTLSVLQGSSGRQQRELRQLTEWLQTQPRPDVVHLSNALLLGLAPALRAALDVPIVCSLQDEDTWLDALPEPYRTRCWDRVRDLCREVALFIPVSATYAAAASKRLDLTEDRCRIIPPGVDITEFTPAPNRPDRPVIGYLSELKPTFGLDILIEAFILLRQHRELAGLQLKITGGELHAKNNFIESIRRRLAESGCADAVAFEEAFRQPRRTAFLQSLSVLSVPARRPEACGLFLLEAMACGVPVCQPDLGGYPEIIAATGGGLIYRDQNPAGLAAALHPLLTDRALAARFGQAGRQAVVSNFSLERVTREMTRVYHEAAKQRLAGDNQES